MGFFIEALRRGGSARGEGEGGPRGREGVCGDVWVGGSKYFFRGRNSHQGAHPREGLLQMPVRFELP